MASKIHSTPLLTKCSLKKYQFPSPKLRDAQTLLTSTIEKFKVRTCRPAGAEAIDSASVTEKTKEVASW
jgi:hypothetical protein